MAGLKTTIFTAAKWLGLFHLSRFLMRRRLLILCYHGIALQDEADFRPMLFMREGLFRQRLETIKRYRFPVLPLQKALSDLRNGTMVSNGIVITIDDGFYNALSRAAPLLKKFDLPATLYLTSYYVEKGTPIFRLVVQYMLWKTQVTQLEPLGEPWGPDQGVSLADERLRHAVTWKIIEYGETQCDEDGREDICRTLGGLLQVDYDQIVESRILSLMTPEELPRMEALGVDLQLHTHRHRLPVGDEETCKREIRDNRKFMLSILEEHKHHLCYPSGEWNEELWECLESEGVASATTCEAGLNTAKTPPLRLYRILDQDDLSQIEFEAELFGFCELIRIVAGKRKRDQG